MKTFTALLAFLVSIVYASADETFQEELNFKPGEETSYEKKWDGFRCKVSWRVQGGTNEKWFLSGQVNDGKDEVLCTVERGGQPSYLVFEKFEMQLSGPGVRLHQHEARGAGKLLGLEEFQVDKAAGTVKHMEGKFSKSLEKMTLLSIGNREEL